MNVAFLLIMSEMIAHRLRTGYGCCRYFALLGLSSSVYRVVL